MNILLINPPYRYSKEITSGGVNPPLSLMYLASYCESKGHKVRMIDSIIEAPGKISKLDGMYYRGLGFDEILKRIDNKTDIIGITNLFSSSYPIVKRFVSYLKENCDIPIVLGGANVSALPHYVLKDSKTDFVVISEGEESFNELCDAIEIKNNAKIKKIDGIGYKAGNKICINKKTKFIKDIGLLPFPNRDLILPMEYSKHMEGHGGSKYIWTSILSSRGCPFGCTFCTSNIWERRWRYRTAKNVVDEIEYCMQKYHVREIHFEDENLTLAKKRIIEICDEIIKRKLDITWQPANGIRASVTDKDILKKMKKSGCNYVVVAPESGSKNVLNNIIKKDQDLKKVSSVIRDAMNLKMKTGAYFMIGLPDEKVKDAKLTISYANSLARIGLDECVFSPFTPLPGSELFSLLQERGMIELNDEFFKELFASGDISQSKSWSKYMTSDQIKDLKMKGYLQFHLNRILFHPINSINSFKNVLIDKHELKSEKALKIIINRWIRKKFSSKA